MAPQIRADAKKKIDDYIRKAPGYSQPIMRRLRTIIRKADKAIAEDWTRSRSMSRSTSSRGA